MMNKKFIALSMLMFASWQGRLMSMIASGKAPTAVSSSPSSSGRYNKSGKDPLFEATQNKKTFKSEPFAEAKIREVADRLSDGTKTAKSVSSSRNVEKTEPSFEFLGLASSENSPIAGQNPMFAKQKQEIEIRDLSTPAEPQATLIETLSAVPEAQVVSQQRSWFRNPFSRSKTTSSEQAGKTIENVSQSEPVVAEPVTQLRKDYKDTWSIYQGTDGKVDLANQLLRPTEPKIDSKSSKGIEYREFLSGTSYASLGSKLTGELSNGYTSKSQVITDIANKMLLDMRIPESVLTSPRFVSRQWNAIKSNFSKEVEVANQQTNQQTRLSKISQAMSNFGQSISQYVSSMFGKEVTTNTTEQLSNQLTDTTAETYQGSNLISTSENQLAIIPGKEIQHLSGPRVTRELILEARQQVKDGKDLRSTETTPDKSSSEPDLDA